MSKYHKNQNKKKYLSIEIVVDIVERKVKSLLTSYRRERRKVADANKSEIGADDIEVPKWFAYRRFTFLDGFNKPR